MKKRFAILAMALGMLMSFNGFSQKFGHINADELLQLMPETKQAQTDLETYGKQLEKDLADMESEYQTKVAAFRQGESLWTTVTKEAKAKEIQDIQARIQKYSQDAQADLQQKQVELLTPIIEKAQQAVKDVANEGKFTYIFDSSPSKAVLIFTDNGEDIMDKVKAKLGIL